MAFFLAGHNADFAGQRCGIGFCFEPARELGFDVGNGISFGAARLGIIEVRNRFQIGLFKS